MGDFRKLQVWERAHWLTLDIYDVTRPFPKEEMFGLTSQMRRASASIPANIAEGSGRTGDTELARFLRIAMGSANELEYHLLLARDLGYLQPTHYERLTAEAQGVAKMLASFIARLRHANSQQPKASSQQPAASSQDV
ncbi:MAG: four helix bundle protein [Thermomicrobiales bacterium]